jgi:cytochrome oxidase Cu insertion factor (SCO1/SenC/PrrC family)
VLLTFLGLHCPARCPAEAAQLRWILQGLPAAERPTLLIVSADASRDTRSAVRRQVRSWGLDGDWTWHWLDGAKTRLAGVWHAYGLSTGAPGPEISRLPALTLIDRSGFERTAYLFPFQPPSVQGDLAELARASA